MILLLVSTAFATPAPELLEALSGKWRPKATESLQAELDASLERTVEGLHWAFRPFARPLLRRQMEVCPALNTQLTGERFQARCPNGAIDLDRALDSSEPGFKGEDGAWYEVTMKELDRGIAAVFTSEKTVYTVFYERSGEELRLRTRIESTQLNEPLDWTVPYLPAP